MNVDMYRLKDIDVDANDACEIRDITGVSAIFKEIGLCGSVARIAHGVLLYLCTCMFLQLI